MEVNHRCEEMEHDGGRIVAVLKLKCLLCRSHSQCHLALFYLTRTKTFKKAGCMCLKLSELNY